MALQAKQAALWEFSFFSSFALVLRSDQSQGDVIEQNGQTHARTHVTPPRPLRRQAESSDHTHVLNTEAGVDLNMKRELFSSLLFPDCISPFVTTYLPAHCVLPRVSLKHSVH